MSIQKTDNNEFDIHLMELVRLRIAQLNRCAYCIELHYSELKSLGEIEVRLSSLFVWKDVPYFSKRERAVLNLAEDISNNKNYIVFGPIFESLRVYYSEEKIYSLILAIKQIVTWTLLMKNFKKPRNNYQLLN